MSRTSTRPTPGGLLTDHVLVSVAEQVRAFDPRTGERRWEYTPPAQCEVWQEEPPTMAGAIVIFEPDGTTVTGVG